MAVTACVVLINGWSPSISQLQGPSPPWMISWTRSKPCDSPRTSPSGLASPPPYSLCPAPPAGPPSAW